ncbi:TPA: hypothetical protein N0F65_010393 [Lagenidium giganteum]|uniref:Uncharacterized protein n=1 Tax=Lagenidium giganteum TaxID=4803 RepID=A0AAV2YSK8_9STRA|nr:TPA: hypothetical protein N0F65_010393 [Lagenidium giganteum]
MAQGSNILKNKKGTKNASAKPVKKKKEDGHKHSAAKFTKKGNPTTEIRRGCSGMKKNGTKEVTGLINRNIEEIMASRVLQAGTTLALKDVRSVGKERLKEINRTALTKKKSRVAQKLESIEKAIKEQEEGIAPTKKKK